MFSIKYLNPTCIKCETNVTRFWNKTLKWLHSKWLRLWWFYTFKQNMNFLSVELKKLCKNMWNGNGETLVNIEAAAKKLVMTNVSDRPTLNNKMNK